MPWVTGRGDFNYRVIRWCGNKIDEVPAGVDDYDMAIACFDIACGKYPSERITLQQGARVIEKSLG